MAAAPEELKYKQAIGQKDKNYVMGFSALDCTGCGNCVDVCIAQEKALVMVSLEEHKKEYERCWEFMQDMEPGDMNKKKVSTVKESQFLKPLMEFSGACAGCGETPYAKLVTQLFGDRMVISTSAGCATVWSGSTPSVPYAKNKHGRGPAWGFSLFEDNAEYGYGMHLGANAVRMIVAKKISEFIPDVSNENLKKDMIEWYDGLSVSEGTYDRANALITSLEKEKDNPAVMDILKYKDYLVKQSNWVFGGDGWAYDIGYGGLDHVLASGEDINVLVFDTEVYSNTGGQSSKATTTAAIAKFAAAGKKTKKKDLGMMAISYGYVYVAQIAMGADMNQTLKAILEAEAYPGPSLIIAYAPCVNHGIKAGMRKAQRQAQRAVEAGYWSLYRYNPSKKKEGKNPFVLDSKPPTASFEEFLMSEVRYSSLMKEYPAEAEELMKKAKEDAYERIDNYTNLSKRLEGVKDE
jgi:pyruvate-ferredoxin/flavodoxin oxidoreductase